MRHMNRGRQLSRDTEHRKALRRNMAQSLFEHGKIRTTLPKAKEVRSFVEKLITLARTNTLTARRRVIAMMRDRRLVDEKQEFTGQNVVQKLFTDVAPNSLDAVSNRDFVLDYLSAAATCATHLSQFGAELVLWSSEEFGFCELPDAFASGSSIMPQKKNPDAAELLRAKAPRIVGHLAALHGVLHALPMAYNKDLQEDKEHLFDTVDTVELALNAACGMVAEVRFKRERLTEAAGDEMLGATDVADLLVRRGVPFRESHGIVAGLVRHALERGVALSELTEEELAERAPTLDASYYQVLEQASWLESKVSAGGTSLERVREQIEHARGILQEQASRTK